MTLKKQLLLVSLLTLALPWAGCQYVIEMEKALRLGQSQNVQATAQAVSLMAQANHNWADPLTEYPTTNQSVLYLPQLSQTMILDGYFSDWEADEENQRTFAFDNQTVTLSSGLKKLAGEERLWLFIAMTDHHKVYAAPNSVTMENKIPTPNSDGVFLISGSEFNKSYWFVSAEAPGAAHVKRLSRDDMSNNLRWKDDPRIKAIWQDQDRGIHLELSMPTDVLTQGLAIVVQNQQPSGERDYHWLGGEPLSSIQELFQVVPNALLTENALLQQLLSQFNKTEFKLSILNNQGWLLAESEPATSTTPTLDLTPSTLEQIMLTLFRWLVKSKIERNLALHRAHYQYQGKLLEGAINGIPQTQWAQLGRTQKAKVVATVPVLLNQTPVAVVLAEQTREAFVTLSDQAILKLIYVSILVIALVVAGLIIYASLLSFRIRKLKQITDDAFIETNHPGPLDKELNSLIPTVRSRDEIGDLYRSFAQLFQHVHHYTAYLNNLSSKLSHELRTPLAIVRSSLDNLADAMQTDQQKTYLSRAIGGLNRLQSILNAMSEANRVEQSIQATDIECFAPTEVARECFSAYRDSFPNAAISTEIQDSNALVNGSPDLIAQMLDKLIENAVDFAQGHNIQFTVTVSQALSPHITMRLCNEGSQLPKNFESRIFNSLISVREKLPPPPDNGQAGEREKDSPHLGLGLYIAHLIVDFHGGTIQAYNLHNPERVCFEIKLPVLG